MENNVYIMLSRQLALFRDMEVTANNIANANTTGYNAERITFTSYLQKDINKSQPNPMAFAHDIASYRDTRQGPLKSTGNALDMAISGKAYFAVETPMGTRYTRAGNFQLDATGILTTAEGYPVLDANNQRITFPEDTVTIEVGEAGNIKVNDEEFANLGVFEFDNDLLLERTSSSLYKSEITPLPSESARVMQGALENSNIEPVKEMTHMIDVSRSVGSTAKFIEVIYDLQRKTANTWAQQG